MHFMGTKIKKHLYILTFKTAFFEINLNFFIFLLIKV